MATKDSTPARIGRAIAAARKRRGLTQMQLSDRCGIAQSDISHLENGYANPTLYTLIRLADALDCQLDVNFNDMPGTGTSSAQ